MVKILVYILVLVAAVSVVANPWVPSILYSLNAILQPKYVWPWTFPDLATSKIAAIWCILAWFVAVARKTIDLSIYNRKQNLLLLMLWGLIHLSNILSPYPVYFAGVKADIVLGALNSIMILYFVQLGLLTLKEKWQLPLMRLVAVFICFMFFSV